MNLAEGRGRGTKADQKRFFHMAFGSVRECQAILDISPERGSLRPSRREPSADAVKLADVVAANVYCLIRSFPLRSAFRRRSASRPKLWRDRLRSMLRRTRRLRPWAAAESCSYIRCSQQKADCRSLRADYRGQIASRVGLTLVGLRRASLVLLTSHNGIGAIIVPKQDDVECKGNVELHIRISQWLPRSQAVCLR